MAIFLSGVGWLALIVGVILLAFTVVKRQSWRLPLGVLAVAVVAFVLSRLLVSFGLA